MSLISYRQLAENFGRAVFACLSSAVSNRFYNINKFAAARGERCRALPFMRWQSAILFLHSYQAKCKFWDQWTESQEEETPTTVFMELSEKPDAVTEEQISTIERFIGFVYYEQCINSVDSERMGYFKYSLYGNLWLIPPSRSGLKEHIRHAAYYAVWANFPCVENVCLPSPSDWGWRFSNGLFTPLWHSSQGTINADFLTATSGCPMHYIFMHSNLQVSAKLRPQICFEYIHRYFLILLIFLVYSLFANIAIPYWKVHDKLLDTLFFHSISTVS